MGAFSIWHWVIVLFFIIIPILIIKLKKTDNNNLKRKGFIIRSVAMIVTMMLATSLFDLGIKHTAYFVVLFILNYSFLIYTFIIIIKRLNDVNKSRWLALLTLIPFFNFIFFLYLCIAPSVLIKINPYKEVPDNLKNDV